MSEQRPDLTVREARVEEAGQVTAVLDAAMLAVDHDAVTERARAGEAFVAIRERDSETILGAVVLDSAEITAIAVRPRRRGQGIGRALVDHAARRTDDLSAGFDPRVREFWASLGFEVETREGTDRLRGSLQGRPDGRDASVE